MSREDEVDLRTASLCSAETGHIYIIAHPLITNTAVQDQVSSAPPLFSHAPLPPPPHKIILRTASLCSAETGHIYIIAHPLITNTAVQDQVSSAPTLFSHAPLPPPPTTQQSRG